jgi:hypothetical protein
VEARNAAASTAGTGEGVAAPARDAISSSETKISRVDREVIRSPFS